MTHPAASTLLGGSPTCLAMPRERAVVYRVGRGKQRPGGKARVEKPVKVSSEVRAHAEEKEGGEEEHLGGAVICWGTVGTLER